MTAEIVWDTGTILFAGIVAVPLVTMVGVFWYKFQHMKADNELKQSMVERGMSAAEIEQVLAAKSKD